MLPAAGPGAGVAPPSLDSETLVVGLDLMIRSSSRRAGGDAREEKWEKNGTPSASVSHGVSPKTTFRT